MRECCSDYFKPYLKVLRPHDTEHALTYTVTPYLEAYFLVCTLTYYSLNQKNGEKLCGQHWSLKGYCGGHFKSCLKVLLLLIDTDHGPKYGRAIFRSTIFEVYRYIWPLETKILKKIVRSPRVIESIGCFMICLEL